MGLREVAEEAEVSLKTASRALNGTGYVSLATRERVERTAARLGYVRNRAASAMRSGSSDLVGLMAHQLITSPLTTEINRGVEDVLQQRGRALLIADAAIGGRGRCLAMFREFRVGAVLFATSYHRAADALVAPDDAARLVLINCYLESGDAAAFVPDDEAGGYLQAAALIRMGHRRIGMIELPEPMIARSLRGQGAMRAMAEAGLAFEADLVRVGQRGDPTNRETVAYEQAIELLDRRDRPTALICSKDEFALQTYGAAAHLGLSVPGDVSIIGFDDVTMISANMRPSLTSVALPYFEMGREAAGMATSPDPIQPGVRRLACHLVERGSCRAIG